MASLEKKRESWGTAGGAEYIRSLAALLFLRGLNHTEHFLMATNLAGAGVFSDNVFVFVESEEATACFIRQQEQGDSQTEADPRQLADHLLEYFVSFREILQSIPWLEQLFGVDVHNVEVIHYTDCKFSAERSTSLPDHILDTGGLILNLHSEPSAYEFLDELKQYNNFLNEFITDTGETNNTQIIEHFKSSITSKEIRNKLENLKNRPSKEEAQRLSLEIEGLVNKKKFQTFLRQFRIFHSQASPNNMRSVIRDEFIKVCGGDVGCVKDMENIFEDFIKRVEKWIEDADSFLTEDATLWRDVVNEMASVLSEPKKKEIQNWGVQFNDECLDVIRNCLDDNSVVSMLTDSDEVSLSVLKVHQALRNECHLLVDMTTLLSRPCEVFQTWGSPWCTVLVLESTAVDLAEVRVVCSEICNILERRDTHRLVLVAARGDVVARTCIQELRTDCWEHVDITALSDLSALSQASLLSKQVQFQGVMTSLSTVLDPYPELLDRIRGNLLISLLRSDERIIIGHALSPVTQDYFPRTLTRSKILSKEVFHNVNDNTLLAIIGATPEELSELLPYGEEPGAFDPATEKESIMYDSSFLTLKDSIEEDLLKDLVDEEFADLHCLEVKDGVIEWKWSKGDTNYLKQFIVDKKTKSFQCNLASDVADKVALVVGEPGVGKSTFLSALATQTKHAYPSTWVVLLNLKMYGDYISNTLFDGQDKVVAFLECIIGVTDSKSKLIFTQSLYKSGNIVIFVDGFEDVPSYLIDKIAFMIKLLMEMKMEQIFITCRPEVIEELQETFHSLPYTIRPLNVEDQKCFLIDKWSKKLPDIGGLEKFVHAVLSLLKISIGAEESKLSNTALQSVMVTETFMVELNTYITAGIISLSRHLNLVNLYDKFVDKMCVVLLKTKRNSSVIDQHMLIENKMNLCDKYMTISLMISLSSEDLNRMDVHSLQYRYNRDLVELKSSCTLAGSLIDISNGKPEFKYPTLCEYFVAIRFAETYMSERDFLEYLLFKPAYKLIRIWFDRVLCKNCELHNAVMNKETGRIRSLFGKGVDVNKTDSGGRTALHLAAMYDMGDIVKILVKQGADVNIPDYILKWRPLRYADQAAAWASIDMLIEPKASVADVPSTMDVIRNESLVNKVLVLACQQGYVGLIDFIYSHGVDVRMVIDFEGSSALHLASTYGKSDLVQYLIRYEAEVTKYGTHCRNILQYLNMNCFSYAGNILAHATADVNVMTNNGSTPLLLAAEGGHTDTVQCLINLGASVNLCKLDGCTALHLAAKGGYEGTVKCLIQYGAEVNQPNVAGLTPLLLAAMEGHTNTIFSLLQNRADANSVDNDGSSVLHWASKGGYLDSLRWLIQAGADVDLQDSGQCTALHWAAREGHDTCAQCLVAAGASTRTLNSDDATPVHLAAKKNSIRTLMCLSEAGADVNVTNSDKSTPLHWASRKGHRAAVKCLIELGAKIDVVNNEGYSPLHIAAWGGHAGVVKLLIEAGADVEANLSYHSPVLHIAARGGHTEVVKCLIEKGANVNVSDNTGSTPLHWASWGDHRDTVALLLRSGAKWRLLDNNGSSPLHWAAGEGNTDVVRTLIEAGALVDVYNRDGASPLHWAAKEGHVDTAKVLVEAGADINKANAEGSTPIHLAMLEPHGDMIEYLVHVGADVTC